MDRSSVKEDYEEKAENEVLGQFECISKRTFAARAGVLHRKHNGMV